MTARRVPGAKSARTIGKRLCQDERGSVAIEMVVAVVPLAVMLILLTAGFIRQVHTRDVVDQAAQQAARAASLGPGYGAADRASKAAVSILASIATCSNPRVSLTNETAADAVTANVSCTVGLSDLIFAGFPGHETISASATSPRDIYAPGGTP